MLRLIVFFVFLYFCVFLFVAPYSFNILAEMVMRETLGGFQGGLQIGGRMITNLRCADDIILLATSEAELQELVDRLYRVSREYSLLINVDKTKVIASDGPVRPWLCGQPSKNRRYHGRI